MKAIGKTGIVAIMLVGVVLLFGGSCLATYNRLVRLDERADAERTQLAHAEQRRADLVRAIETRETDPDREVFVARSRALDRLGVALAKVDGVRGPDLRDLRERLAEADREIDTARADLAEATRAFNKTRSRFPMVIVADMFDRFAPKPEAF